MNVKLLQTQKTQLLKSYQKTDSEIRQNCFKTCQQTSAIKALEKLALSYRCYIQTGAIFVQIIFSCLA